MFNVARLRYFPFFVTKLSNCMTRSYVYISPCTFECCYLFYRRLVNCKENSYKRVACSWTIQWGCYVACAQLDIMRRHVPTLSCMQFTKFPEARRWLQGLQGRHIWLSTSYRVVDRQLNLKSVLFFDAPTEIMKNDHQICTHKKSWLGPT